MLRTAECAGTRGAQGIGSPTDRSGCVGRFTQILVDVEL